jgi:hypothetical protein
MWGGRKVFYPALILLLVLAIVLDWPLWVLVVATVAVIGVLAAVGEWCRRRLSVDSTAPE